MNVSQDTNNRRANLQFKSSKIKVTGHQKLPQMTHVFCTCLLFIQYGWRQAGVLRDGDFAHCTLGAVLLYYGCIHITKRMAAYMSAQGVATFLLVGVMCKTTTYKSD